MEAVLPGMKPTCVPHEKVDRRYIIGKGWVFKCAKCGITFVERNEVLNPTRKRAKMKKKQRRKNNATARLIAREQPQGATNEQK